MTEGIEASVESLIHLRFQAQGLKINLRNGRGKVGNGQYISTTFAKGMEYSESRQYQPGDDVRHIDWRVTARTGQAHSKLYVEEKQRDIYFVGDFSNTLYFGTKGTYKSVLAAQTTALLAWIANNQGDRVGAVLAHQNQLTELKPKANRQGVLQLINALSTITTKQNYADTQSQRSEALGHLYSVIKPGSLVFILSDFLDMTEKHIQHLIKIRAHNTVYALQLRDPIEIQAPKAGIYHIADSHHLENRTTFNTHQKDNALKYQDFFQQQQERLKKQLGRANVPLIELVNGVDLLKSLRGIIG